MQRPWTWSDWARAWHALLSPPHTRSRQTSAVRARWALDVALVVEGRRTAVLFDAAALSWRECLAWVAWVEEHRLPVMLVLFEPARHVFLVNIHALDSLRHHPPVFVDPARAAQALDVPASALAALALLEDAAHRSQRSVLLRSDAPHARLCGVALCGWLLGYPVVYAVTQKPAIFTTHAPGLCDGRAWDADAWSDDDARPAGAMSLLLVEATVHTELPGALPTCGLPMMSFSIPTALPHAVHVAHAWQHRLEATWDERPMRLPFLEHATCEVRMSHVHQDHIVL